MSARELLSAGQVEALSQELISDISDAVTHAESIEDPPLESLVEDVFATPPRHLTKQVVDALRIIDEQGEADNLQGKFPL